MLQNWNSSLQQRTVRVQKFVKEGKTFDFKWQIDDIWIPRICVDTWVAASKCERCLLWILSRVTRIRIRVSSGNVRAIFVAESLYDPESCWTQFSSVVSGLSLWHSSSMSSSCDSQTNWRRCTQTQLIPLMRSSVCHPKKGSCVCQCAYHFGVFGTTRRCMVTESCFSHDLCVEWRYEGSTRRFSAPWYKGLGRQN